MRKVLFYTTSACTLCDEAEDVLLPICHQAGLRLFHVDISESETLLNKYGERIPVIALELNQVLNEKLEADNGQGLSSEGEKSEEKEGGLKQESLELDWPFSPSEAAHFLGLKL